MSEPIHTNTSQIVVFTLDEQSYALYLSAVVKVIHAIEIRHLPDAPDVISGIINVNGRIIPVVNFRKRFGIEEREIELTDQIILAVTGKREVAIPVDSVTGLLNLTPDQLVNIHTEIPFSEQFRGVAKVNDSMILIHDLNLFLSLDEEKKLVEALKTKK